jgi:hypothetical protein
MHACPLVNVITSFLKRASLYHRCFIEPLAAPIVILSYSSPTTFSAERVVTSLGCCSARHLLHTTPMQEQPRRSHLYQLDNLIKKGVCRLLRANGEGERDEHCFTNAEAHILREVLTQRPHVCQHLLQLLHH